MRNQVRVARPIARASSVHCRHSSRARQVPWYMRMVLVGNPASAANCSTVSVFSISGADNPFGSRPDEPGLFG